MLTNIHTVHLLVIVSIDVTLQSHFRVYKIYTEIIVYRGRILDLIGTKEFSSLCIHNHLYTNGFYSDPWS